jgi:hypothetical protein
MISPNTTTQNTIPSWLITNWSPDIVVDKEEFGKHLHSVLSDRLDWELEYRAILLRVTVDSTVSSIRYGDHACILHRPGILLLTQDGRYN